MLVVSELIDVTEALINKTHSVSQIFTNSDMQTYLVSKSTAITEVEMNNESPMKLRSGRRVARE